MIITYKLLKEKEQLIGLLPLTQEEQAQNSQSKLKHAMMRWGKSIKSIYENMQELQGKASLEFASEDEKTKCLLTDNEGRFQYTKENEQLKRNKLKDIDLTEVNIEPYLFTDEERINTFDPFIVEELRGIFFPLLND